MDSVVEINQKLSKTIQTARFRKKLTLKALEELIGLPSTTIQAIEAQPIRVPLCDLYKLITALDIGSECYWLMPIRINLKL